MSKERKVTIAGKAKQLTDKLLVGTPSGQAIKESGYQVTRQRNTKRVMETKGVQFYLKRINQALEEENKKFLASPESKSQAIEVRVGEKILPRLVIKAYVEGLNATRLYGRNAKVYPDFKTRMEAADRLAEFFKWRRQEGAVVPTAPTYSQFNFFSVPKEKRGAFDNQFKEFLQHFYKTNKDQG